MNDQSEHKSEPVSNSMTSPRDEGRRVEAIAEELAFEAESLTHNDGWFDRGEFTARALDALRSALREGEQRGRQAGIAIDVSDEERDWVQHAAKLRHLSLTEYVKEAINASLQREGVDAVLLRTLADQETL